MTRDWPVTLSHAIVLGLALAGCGGDTKPHQAMTSFTPIDVPDDLPQAGTADREDIPVSGLPDNVSDPTTVIGTGTAESCSDSQTFIDAVWKGGIITFNCGSAPVTINL